VSRGPSGEPPSGSNQDYSVEISLSSRQVTSRDPATNCRTRHTPEDLECFGEDGIERVVEEDTAKEELVVGHARTEESAHSEAELSIKPAANGE